MARAFSGKRPNDFWKTLKKLLRYMGNHKFLLLIVAILVSISALASLLGTYMLKPIVNNYIVPADAIGLLKAVIFTGIIYLLGVGASFWLYPADGKSCSKDCEGNSTGFICSCAEAYIEVF